jgi:MraZ protein
VRYPVLFGEYELTIDDKNRLLVPAEVRRSIPPEQGEALFTFVGINQIPWLYPEGYYKELVTQTPAEMTPSDDVLAYNQLYFAMANRVPWDKQGRILMPERVLQEASIKKEVTLIGARDHLELWNRGDWNQRREELRRRSAEIVSKAKVAQRAP